MFSLPSPLHPAVVHFPIVLILIGTVAALGAAFTRRWSLPLAAAVLLALGAVGTAVSYSTGDREGEYAEGTAGVERLLDEHESWAERTRAAAIAAAVLAIAAVATARWQAASRALAICTAAVAIASSWCVAETGHRGGQLVYRHGTGVMKMAAADGATSGSPAGAASAPKREHRENDDD